jgi:hypothetical protein
LKPPLVVSGHYQRYAWTVRSLIALYPRLFFPVVGLKARERSWMIQDETRLVIDGFPRSANNFALTAFLFAQAEMVNVSHHMHAPAQVMAAARKNLPTLAGLCPIRPRNKPSRLSARRARAGFLLVRS